MPTQKFCLACDLVDDAGMIAEYKAYHKKVSPDIIKSIKDAGVTIMDIYCAGNRMFMILEADAAFSFEKKTAMDEANPKVKEWEALMWKFQQALPWAKPGEKWMMLEKIFELP